MKNRTIRREPEVTVEDLRYWARLPKARRKLRIYADAGVPLPSVEALRSAGTDVFSVLERSLENRTECDQDDEYHFVAARKMGRILLTTDNDFWDDKRFPLHESGGVVVVLPGQSRDPLAPASLFYRHISVFLKEGVSRLPNIWRESKLRVTSDLVVERHRTFESRVEEVVFWRKASVHMRS